MLDQEPEEAFWAEPVESLAVEEEVVCRMLGVVNGRTEFAPSETLKWSDECSLMVSK